MTFPETTAATAGNAGFNTNSSSQGSMPNSDAASMNSTSSGRPDDVSFAKSLGVDDVAEKAKDVASQGAAGVEDAVSQLQAKATEFTNNLIDRINVDDLTQKLEHQVREHPARTLLFAAGAGFLLGRAAKK